MKKKIIKVPYKSEPLNGTHPSILPNDMDELDLAMSLLSPEERRKVFNETRALFNQGAKIEGRIIITGTGGDMKGNSHNFKKLWNKD